MHATQVSTGTFFSECSYARKETCIRKLVIYRVTLRLHIALQQMTDSLVFSVTPSIERVEPSDKGHKGITLLATHVRVSNYLLDISLRTDADTKWEWPDKNFCFYL